MKKLVTTVECPWCGRTILAMWDGEAMRFLEPDVERNDAGDLIYPRHDCRPFSVN